jgi:hypothetical protein
MGKQKVYLENQYVLDGYEITTGDLGGPTVKFADGAYITLGANIDGIQIGHIIRMDTTDTLVYGYLGKMRLTAKKYYASYFGLDNVDKLYNTMLAANSWGQYELVWDQSFAFDQHFNDPSTVLHSFDPLSIWEIGDYTVQVQKMTLQDRRMFLVNGSGVINIIDLAEIDPIWFGASNASGVELNINYMMNSVIAFNYNIDWKNADTRVSGTISIPTTAENNIVIRNARITSTDGLEDIFYISGAGQVTLRDSQVSYASLTETNAIINSEVATLICRDNKFINGNIVFNNTVSTEFKNNYVLIGDVHVSSCSGLQEFHNNTFHHLKYCRFYASSGALQLLSVKNNKFMSNRMPNPSFSEPAPGFIEIQPQGVGNLISTVEISGNSYTQLVADSRVAVNVMDLGDTIYNTWSASAPLTLKIKDEIATGTRESMKYTEGLGVFFDLNGGGGSTPYKKSLLDTPSTMFTLNSRLSKIQTFNHSVSHDHWSYPTRSYFYRPGYAWGVDNYPNSTIVKNSGTALIYVSYPEGSPFGDSDFPEGEGTSTISFEFISTYPEI